MPNERDTSPQLLRAVIAASERCQREIAESLHGTLCQTLGGAGLLAKVLEAGIKTGKPADSAQLEALAEMLDRALDEARQVLTKLQPVAPGREGLMSALARLASETTIGPTTCEFECENAVWVDNPEAALFFYRVAEEAVAYAAECARARHIKVSLIERGEAVTLTVTDDRQILLTPNEPELRVETMRCRAQAAGGEFTVESKSGAGRVQFTLPKSAART